ncbi:hypothetical protein D3C76_608460 [compost metagenome]
MLLQFVRPVGVPRGFGFADADRWQPGFGQVSLGLLAERVVVEVEECPWRFCIHGFGEGTALQLGGIGELVLAEVQAQQLHGALVQQFGEAGRPLADAGLLQVKCLQLLPAADIGRQVQRVFADEQGVQTVQSGEGGPALLGQGNIISGHAQFGQGWPTLQCLEVLGGQVQVIAVNCQHRQ